MDNDEYNVKMKKLTAMAIEQVHAWCSQNWQSKIINPSQRFLNEMNGEALVIYCECITYNNRETTARLNEVCESVNQCYHDLNFVRYVRLSINTTQHALGAMLGVSEATIEDWESNKAPVPNFYINALYKIKGNQ